MTAMRPEHLLAALGLPVLLYFGNPALALLYGASLSLVFQRPLLAGTSQYSKLALQTAIVLLGFRLSAGELAAISSDYSLLVTAYVVITFGAGILLGRLFAASRNASLLIASGTAICGGTAIASLSPILGAKPHETGVALTLVFLLNAVALTVFPFVGEALEMTQQQFGVWSALAIHDTSSVVATSALYGEEATIVATTVKLGRTLWLIPLMIGASYVLAKGKSGAKLPLFVGLFILVAVLGSFVEWPALLKSSAALVVKGLLVIALFLIGSEIKRETLAGLRGATLWHGVVLWLLVTPAVLAAVLALH